MKILDDTYYGGLICHVNYNKEPPFKLFMKMVNNPSCRISKISYSSLKGFILKLDIDRPSNLDNLDEIAPFLGLNIEKTEYNVPVFTLVIKLVVLSRTETNMTKYISLDEKQFNKQTDIYSDFEKEAKTQSEIYKNTINKGDPVCPSLVAIAKITDKTVSLEFLKLLKKKCGSITESENMISYIIKELENNSSYQLGVIVMESATEYKTVDAFFKGISKESQYNILCKLIFMIIRLVNETGYIHCDLHLNNAMVKYNDDSKIVMRLIDFGRVVYIYEKKLKELIIQNLTTKLWYIIYAEKNYNKSKGFGDFSRVEKYVHAIEDIDGTLVEITNQLIDYAKFPNTINSDCYRLIQNYDPSKEDLLPFDEELKKKMVKDLNYELTKLDHAINSKNIRKTKKCEQIMHFIDYCNNKIPELKEICKRRPGCKIDNDPDIRILETKLKMYEVKLQEEDCENLFANRNEPERVIVGEPEVAVNRNIDEAQGNIAEIPQKETRRERRKREGNLLKLKEEQEKQEKLKEEQDQEKLRQKEKEKRPWYRLWGGNQKKNKTLNKKKKRSKVKSEKRY